MFDANSLKFFLGGVTLILASIVIARLVGLLKLYCFNYQNLKKLKKLKKETADPLENNALNLIINHCQNFNSKWILSEPDLDILANTYQLIDKISSVYHPESPFPLEEARIRSVLNAFVELKNHLLLIINRKEVHAITQFRIGQIVTLSQTWEKGSPPKYPTRRVSVISRAAKMVIYITHYITLKILLTNWYLVIGKLAIRIYSDVTKEPYSKPEILLEDLHLMTESENLYMGNLPKQIRIVAETSRNKILFTSWSIEWPLVKEIYINLIKDVASEYNPQKKDPIYEAKLSEVIASGSRFLEQIAAIQTYPFCLLKIENLDKFKVYINNKRKKN